MLGLPIGNALAFVFSGMISRAFEDTVVMGHKIGWRAAFYVALIPGLLCGLGARCSSGARAGSHGNSRISARRSETEIRIG